MRAEFHLRGVTKPLCIANGLHCGLARFSIKTINEQDAVQVICFVLHSACKQFAALNDNRLTVHVEALRHDPHCTRCVERESGERQAPFGPILQLIGEIEIRIDEVTHDAIHAICEHPQGDTDLRSGKPGPRGVKHGLREVPHEHTQLLVEDLDGQRLGLQYGITEEADLLERHGARLPVEVRLQARVDPCALKSR